MGRRAEGSTRQALEKPPGKCDNSPVVICGSRPSVWERVAKTLHASSRKGQLCDGFKLAAPRDGFLSSCLHLMYPETLSHSSLHWSIFVSEVWKVTNLSLRTSFLVVSFWATHGKHRRYDALKALPREWKKGSQRFLFLPMPGISAMILCNIQDKRKND